MYDSMLHMQMQEACHAAQPRLRGQLGAMPLTGVFETTDGAVCMVGALQAEPAARHLRGPGPGRGPVTLRPEFADLEAAVRAQAGAAGHLPRAQSPPTPPSTGSPGWRTRTSCAPRCTPWSEALADEQTAANNMIVEMRTPRRRHRAGAQRARSGSPPPRPRIRRRGARGSGEHNEEVLLRARLRRRGDRRACSERGCSDDRRADDRVSADQVTLSIEDHVARVTIDRQHVLNAVDGAARPGCNEIWDQIEGDPERAAVVVVTGAGDRAFCVGADMSAAAVGQDRPGVLGRPGPQRLRRAEPAHHPGRPGDRPGQRLRARRRHGDRARRGHRDRRRHRPVRADRAARRAAGAGRRHRTSWCAGSRTPRRWACS